MKPDLNIEVMPSEASHPYLTQIHEKNKYKDYLPFHAGKGGLVTIVGGAGSGKTSLLYSMVKKFYHKVYDYIIVYCPTKDSHYAFKQLEYMGIKKDDHTKMRHNTEVHVYHTYDASKFEQFCHEVEENNLQRREHNERPLLTLVIFDDSVGLNIDQKQNPNNAFNRLVLTRRHIPIDIIFVSQRYTDLSLGVRTTNPTALMLTQYLGKVDLQRVVEEHSFGEMTPELLMKLYNETKHHGKHKEDKYQFFQINYSRPTNERFSYGFDKIIDTNE